MISAVIVTLNAKQHLKACLESIREEVDEIVVVDLGSTDKTLEIAKAFQANIFTHERVDYVEVVRNFAVTKAKGDWVLVLDPDERIRPTLWKNLKEIIKEDQYTAVNIPRKNIFFGKWIAHSNWWPDRHIRFFKKGKVRWSDKIHHYPLVKGETLNLPAKEDFAIIHNSYDSFSQFMDRQNRYSEIAAKNLFEEGVRFSWVGFFWKPAREFLVRYIRHAGLLDGFYGIALTYMMMVYQLEVQVKLWELERED